MPAFIIYSLCNIESPVKTFYILVNLQIQFIAVGTLKENRKIKIPILQIGGGTKCIFWNCTAKKCSVFFINYAVSVYIFKLYIAWSYIISLVSTANNFRSILKNIIHLVEIKCAYWLAYRCQSGVDAIVNSTTRYRLSV